MSDPRKPSISKDGRPVTHSSSQASQGQGARNPPSGGYAFSGSGYVQQSEQAQGGYQAGQRPSGSYQTSGQHGMGQHGMGQQGMGQHGMGQQGMGQQGMGQQGMGRTYSQGASAYSGQQSTYQGAHTTTSHHQVSAGGESSYYGGSRVVTGEETVIGINTIEGKERVISERVVEHEVKVPKKLIFEEVIEKIIVIPETITREEYIEEIQKITETIIEVAKPIIQEKIIEVHEIEYRDKIVERVEKIVQEKIREVPKIEYQERIIEVPKYITREKIVEVPEIEYREIVVEKIVEVPEYREQIVIKEVPVTRYVDKPVPEYVDVETTIGVSRNIPVPVEAVTTFEYQLVQFRPRLHTVQYPLYVPRFVEVPVAAELFDPVAIAQLQGENAKLQNLTGPQAVSLCEIEKMATEFRRNDITAAASNMDLQAALSQAWHTNSIQAKSPHRDTSTPGSVSGMYSAVKQTSTVYTNGMARASSVAAVSNATSHKNRKSTSSRNRN